MPVGNPLYDIHAQLWTMLEAVSDITDNVHADNRTKLTSSADSILDLDVSAITGVPELAVVDAGEEIGDRRCSNGTRIFQQWEVWLRGCEQNNDLFTTLKLAVIRALVNWDDATTGLKAPALSWEETYGCLGVTDCDLKSTNESILRSKITHNRGWSALWVGVTELWFGHTQFVS